MQTERDEAILKVKTAEEERDAAMTKAKSAEDNLNDVNEKA